MSIESVTLGCRLNFAESEHMRSLAPDEDMVIVNSCAVTGEAVRQTRQAIRRARRIACRVWRTASLVTAQLLTIIVPSSPKPRIISLSTKLSRQPSVIVVAGIRPTPRDRSRR